MLGITEIFGSAQKYFTRQNIHSNLARPLDTAACAGACGIARSKLTARWLRRATPRSTYWMSRRLLHSQRHRRAYSLLLLAILVR